LAVSLIDQAFVNGKKLYACFVDFRKAYDSVWRNGLFLKLLRYGISNRFVKIIQNMYASLQSCIQLPNGICIPFQSTVGLKQGCNLSHTLFNIFVNDLVNDLNVIEGDAPTLGLTPVGCLLYADNLIIISESESGLQNSLSNLNNFTKKWFLEVNISKTKTLTFAKGNNKKKPITWTLGNKQLESCDSYCYLGVVFTANGSMNAAWKALRAKALGAMFTLLRNTNKYNSLDPSLLLELFDRLVVPIALYNSGIWVLAFY
jgi:hypothetical protein